MNALKIKNTICNATSIRQKETQKIANQVDLMIIIGGKHSSNTNKLYEIAKDYIPLLNSLQQKYFTNLGAMDYVINTLYKTDWNKYNEQEQLTVENTVLLVQLLYKMCKVKFVEKSNKEGEIGKINTSDIDDAKKSAHSFLGNAA